MSLNIKIFSGRFVFIFLSLDIKVAQLSEYTTVKVFWKDAPNLQEKTNAEMWF